MIFAEIILPVAGPCYTFSVSDELANSVSVGCAVSVEFGKKPATGIVYRLTGERPELKNIKPILSLAYPDVVVPPVQMQLWEWLAKYYMCTPGEVMRSALPALLRKGDFVPYKRVVKNKKQEAETKNLPLLTGAQQTALDRIEDIFCTKTTALLFGPPASGKSEVGFHAIARTLARGRDVLLLLPEISLTTQFVQRVNELFGDRVVLWHSGLTDKRRAEAYLNLLSSSPRLIIGTRSSIFLPLQNLGLVVVDEEQDPSYKQQDPAPRYNARDAAIVLAKMCGAKVILTGAAPSLETWANSVAGKYGPVHLTERYGGALPPNVIVSDTLRSARRGERKSHFNKELSDRIANVLARGEQAIIFQNLRGATVEDVESELLRFFPSARVGHVIKDFEAGKLDILVGTQIVTKGLDFDRVSLTAILNADNLLTYPDFRASERAFGLIANVAGRAGRRGTRGEVVIQTADPTNRLIVQAAAGDYEAMAVDMLSERAGFGYPPYSRLVSVTLRHRDKGVLSSAAARFGELLREKNPVFELLGPEPPVSDRGRGEHALVYLLKIPRSQPLAVIRDVIRTSTRTLLSDPAFRRVTITPNIDPQ